MPPASPRCLVGLSGPSLLQHVFPIDRLRELKNSGEIGQVAKRLWSGFMGRIYNRSKVLNESAPEFVEKLNEDGVDILIAAPA